MGTSIKSAWHYQCLTKWCSWSVSRQTGMLTCERGIFWSNEKQNRPMVVFSTSHRWAKALAWSYQHYFKLLFFFPIAHSLCTSSETRGLLPAAIEGWPCLSKRQVKFMENTRTQWREHASKPPRAVSHHDDLEKKSHQYCSPSQQMEKSLRELSPRNRSLWNTLEIYWFMDATLLDTGSQKKSWFHPNDGPK